MNRSEYSKYEVLEVASLLTYMQSSDLLSPCAAIFLALNSFILDTKSFRIIFKPCRGISGPQYLSVYLFGDCCKINNFSSDHMTLWNKSSVNVRQ